MKHGVLRYVALALYKLADRVSSWADRVHGPLELEMPSDICARVETLRSELRARVDGNHPPELTLCRPPTYTSILDDDRRQSTKPWWMK